MITCEHSFSHSQYKNVSHDSQAADLMRTWTIKSVKRNAGHDSLHDARDTSGVQLNEVLGLCSLTVYLSKSILIYTLQVLAFVRHLVVGYARHEPSSHC